MKTCALLRTAAISLAVGLAACQHEGGAARPPWTSSNKWAESPSGRYVVRNDVWGKGPGAQTIWVRSATQWGVHADHPETRGIKAYPHVGRTVNRRLSALSQVTSRFACTVPAAGSYNSAYDIWCERHAYEIMLWMNWRGKMGPIARSWDTTGKPAIELAGVTIGGHTWDVYKGTNGTNVVFTFLCTSQATAGEVDIKAVLDWIRQKGWFVQPAGGDVRLDDVQFGWEIASSAGGLDFAVSDFAVDVQ